MSKLYEYNLKPEDSLAEIKEIIELNKSYYTDVRIRCVSIKHNEKWYNGIITIKIFTEGDKLDKKENCYYDDFHLLETWIKPKNLLSFLNKIENEEIEIANEKIFIGQKTKFRERTSLPRYTEHSTMPGYLFKASASGEMMIGIPNQPLLSHKFSFYNNIYRAIEGWCEFSHFSDRGDQRFHSILLFLPECRAYFYDLKYKPKENSLLIKIKKNDISLELHIKGEYRSKFRRESFDKKLNLISEIIKINPDDANNMDEFELYLIDEDDCILDHHIENRFNVKGMNRVFGGIVEVEFKSIIKEAISMGENEVFEFKPYIKKGEKKIEEILETVIAFANTKGGNIIMGIDKHGQIEGLERGMRKDAKGIKDLDKIFKEYIGYIKKEISDVLNNPLLLKIDQCEYNGKQLLIIKVPGYGDKPYQNVKTRDIFIRRGASNMKPAANTELLNLYRFDKDRFI